MRILPLAAIAALVAGVVLAGSAAAQSADSATGHKRVLGYQNTETGAFEPLDRAAPDVTLSPTAGTVELSLTITLKTPLPKGGTIVCGVSLTASSENIATATVSSWLEDASSLATVSSSTITCTVYVPYSWLVPAASSTIINTFSGSYSIQMSNAAGVLPSSVRYSEATFLSGKIPATGTITKVTMNAVI